VVISRTIAGFITKGYSHDQPTYYLHVEKILASLASRTGAGPATRSRTAPDFLGPENMCMLFDEGERDLVSSFRWKWAATSHGAAIGALPRSIRL
jgi:hypothetical protein